MLTECVIALILGTLIFAAIEVSAVVFRFYLLLAYELYEGKFDE